MKNMDNNELITELQKEQQVLRELYTFEMLVVNGGELTLNVNHENPAAYGSSASSEGAKLHAKGDFREHMNTVITDACNAQHVKVNKLEKEAVGRGLDIYSVTM